MSALPGIREGGVESTTVVGDTELHKLSIKKGDEWKLNISAESRLTVKITSGIAEIFGTELANEVEYAFQEYRFSLYAVEDIELVWRCQELTEKTLNIQENTTARYVYNLHFALEKLRASSFDGPRIMIIGDSNTGKTALSRTLCSYSIKFKAYQPMFVNLNPSEGIFSPPGCLTATPISDILDVEAKIWGQSVTSGATELHSKQPLVKNFGFEYIKDNRQLYTDVMQQLSTTALQRLQNDALVRRSGCIIDTPPLSALDADFSELQQAIRDFKVNTVILLAEESSEPALAITEKLAALVNNSIIRIPPLSGVMPKDDVFNRSLQRAAIREYFYGNNKMVLSPYTIGVDFQDITAWQPLNLSEGTQNILQQSPKELQPVEINPSNLQHALVAISYAERKATAHEIRTSPILGFALITEVNDKRQKLRILMPVPGRLPNKAMIVTYYKYLE